MVQHGGGSAQQLVLQHPIRWLCVRVCMHMCQLLRPAVCTVLGTAAGVQHNSSLCAEFVHLLASDSSQRALSLVRCPQYGSCRRAFAQYPVSVHCQQNGSASVATALQ
jgi:hypothetical protein